MTKRLALGQVGTRYVRISFQNLFLTSLQVRADIINTLNITYSILIRDSTFRPIFFPIIEKERSPMQSMFFYKVNKILY